MQFVYSDGGRSNYFKASNVGDCVTRAICNATGKDYKEVYDRLKQLAKEETDKQLQKHRSGKRSSVRNGVFKETWKKYLDEIGWQHVTTMRPGTGIQVHLNDQELPKDQIMIVQVSKHLTCVKNSVLYDTYDCTRSGERGVYGYWIAPSKEQLQKLEESKKLEAEKQINAEAIKATKQQIRYDYYKKIAKLEREITKLKRERDNLLANLK